MDLTTVSEADERRERGSQKARRSPVTLSRCPVCGFFGLAADLARAIAQNPALCRGGSKRSN